MHFHNPAQYSDIAGLHPAFILILWQVTKPFLFWTPPLYSQIRTSLRALSLLRSSFCSYRDGDSIFLFPIYKHLTDCSVLCTSTILHNIRISQGYTLLLSSYCGKSLSHFYSGLHRYIRKSARHYVLFRCFAALFAHIGAVTLFESPFE